MIIDEHITSYLHSLEPDPDPELAALRAEAAADGVPIIRREAEGLIRVLFHLVQPKKILEIGTGIGYSAAFMASCSDRQTQIDTIENYPPRIQRAKETIKQFALIYPETKIRLLSGDASETIRLLSGPYDLVFLDGPKAQYLSMLETLLSLLREGGILLADNVLQDGELVRSRFVTRRRDRTIHERMREFIWEVKHHPLLETSVLTQGDGMTVSIKKQEG